MSVYLGETKNFSRSSVYNFQLIIFDHEEHYVTDCKSDNSAGRQKKIPDEH